MNTAGVLLLEFSVLGTNPIPQGSKTLGRNKHTGKPVMFEANASALRQWRRKIRDACQPVWRDLGRPPINAPVHVDARFRFAATKTNPDRFFVARKPDEDHLSRALRDGMVEGELLRDDALVVRSSAVKVFAAYGEEAGVVVAVYDLSDIETEIAEARKRARMRRPVEPRSPS